MASSLPPLCVAGSSLVDATSDVTPPSTAGSRRSSSSFAGGDLANIWLNPNVLRLPNSSSKGKDQWQCLHCNRKFVSFNVSKVKAHLAKKGGHHIDPCGVLHTAEDAALYKRHYDLMRAKSKGRRGLKGALDEQHTAQREDGVKRMLDSQASSSSKRSKQSSTGAAASLKKDPPPTSTITPASLGTKHKKGDGIQPLLTFKKLNEEAKLKLDYALTALIIEGGRCFSMADDPQLPVILNLAKAVPGTYKPPNRNKIVDTYLPMMYEQVVADSTESLQLHKDIFGLGLHCDGATIKKMPLHNFLACGAYNSKAVLEIKDCTDRMAKGGKKDAAMCYGCRHHGEPPLEARSPHRVCRLCHHGWSFQRTEGRPHTCQQMPSHYICAWPRACGVSILLRRSQDGTW
jgi:hypothetical protein